MSFITSAELKTHLYAENVTLISRSDDTILAAAIDGAVQESKGYLAAYDRDVIYAKTGSQRNALLLIFVKDMAVWHFLTLCNAGTELDLRKARYERAIDWHKAVQKGNVSPDLPILVDAEGIPSAEAIIYGSNTKREQHF